VPLAAYGRPSVIKAVIESAILGLGNFPHIKWEKVYDGEGKGNEQSNSRNRFYTRVYRLWVDEKPTVTKIRFTYDRKKNWADVSISIDDLKALKGYMERARKESTEEEVFEL